MTKIEKLATSLFRQGLRVEDLEHIFNCRLVKYYAKPSGKFDCLKAYAV